MAERHGSSTLTTPKTVTEALRRSAVAKDPTLYQWHPWRVGRKVGRTIYVQLGEGPSDDDPLIGVMDFPILAEDAVHAHNAALRQQGRL